MSTRETVLSLASKWRSDGEYWSGDIECATLQQCADDLLAAFGLTDEDRVQYDVTQRQRGYAEPVPEVKP